MDNGFAPGAIVRFSQHGPEISRQRVEEKLTPQTSAGTPFHWYAERSPNEARFCQALLRSRSREARLQPAMRRAAFGGAWLWPVTPTSISKVPLFENLFLRLDAVCFRHGKSWMAALRNR
jgi:hypothetical protein